MSSEGQSSDGSGRQPFSSISSVFSSLFSRDTAARARGPALLTAFRELSDVEDPLPDPRESKQEKEGEPHSRDGEKRSDAPEPELVQVTRVETYSDTENEEEEEASHHSRLRPRADEDMPRCESESESEVPVFRTHNLDRSCFENMLYAEKSRWKNRSKTTGAESNSVSEGTETPNSSSSSKNVGTAESGEYAGIDCSLPVPSIISGATGLGAQDAAADSPAPEKSEMKEGTAGSPEGPETSHVSNRSAPRPNEPPVDPGRPATGHQPALPHSAAARTPDGSTPPSEPSPSPPSFQMPALFSGLRVLKKGAAGGDRDTTAEIKQREKDADLALLSLKKSVNKARLYPEQKTPSPSRKQAADGNTTTTGQTGNTSGGPQDTPANGKTVCENEGGATGEKRPGAPEKRTTSDLAYETFRGIFGTRGARKDKTEDVNLEAVKRKSKSDKENLKSIFERASRTPSKELKSPSETKVRFPAAALSSACSRGTCGAQADAQSGVSPRLTCFHGFSSFSLQAEVTSPTDSEDRTPGRLQAVWPPPKPKDEEEKVGLKYTEAGKKHRAVRSHGILAAF